MAKQIAEVVSNRREYPWKLWTNGKAWGASRGADFSCEPEDFRAQLYTYAKRHQLGVKTAVKGDTVEFKFTK